MSDWLTASTSAWAGAAFAGSIDLDGNQDAVKIDSVGNYAYAVRDIHNSPNFYIFDVSSPAAPITIGSMMLDGRPSNVVVSGDYAYVTSSDNAQELQIVNIATPSAPFLIGSYDADGSANANSVAISGTTVYVVRNKSGDQELLVLDVATPSAPTGIGSVDLGYNAHDIVVSGNYAYIASSADAQELQVVNIATPSTPILLGGYDVTASNANATTVAVSGSVVYLGIASTLYILSDSIHGSPILSGSMAFGGIVNDIAVGSGSMSYLFIGTSYSSNELRIVDVSTPSMPTVFTAVNLVSDANGVAYNSSLDIVVISNADNAAELITVNHP